MRREKIYPDPEQYGYIDSINQYTIEGWFYEKGVTNSYVTLYINGIKTFNVYSNIFRADVNKALKLDLKIKLGFVLKTGLQLSKHDNIVLKFRESHKELTYSPAIYDSLIGLKRCEKTNFLNIFDNTKNTYITISDFKKLSSVFNSDVLIDKHQSPLNVVNRLQYTVYSNKQTATASYEEVVYIKKEALKCVTTDLEFDEFIKLTLLDNWHHKTIYNTTAFDFNLYNNSINKKNNNCFSYWYKHTIHLNLQKRKNILFLISTQDGGTPLTNLDLMLELYKEYNCYVLRCDSKSLYLSTLRNNLIVDIEIAQLSESLTPFTHTSAEYDDYFIDIIYRYNINIVHVRHICWHSLTLYRATEFFSIPLVYSMHDFYAICPSHNLLDENLKYCGGVCTQGGSGSNCSTVLWSSIDVPPLKHCFVNFWRKKFELFFSKCDTFITTSQSTKNIYTKNYKCLHNKINVIPHGRNLKYVNYRNNTINKKLVIIVPGTLTQQKGLDLITQIKTLNTCNNLEFVFINNNSDYKRDDIQCLIKKIAPHIAIVPSIWPETYCHILTEMWSCNIPTIVLNYGAQAERTKKTNNGWIVKSNAKYIYNFFQKLVRNPTILRRKIVTFDESSCKEMTEKYKKIYTHLLKTPS